jgi:RecB family exonuclease
MTRQPMRIVPWSEDFIQALAKHLVNRGSDFEHVRIVFPHNRPARHLRAALAESKGLKRPCLLPRMSPLDEFLHELRRELAPRPLLRAGQLDRIGVLHGIVRALALADGPLSTLCGTAGAFFPWGARLVRLLEEMAGQNIRPAAIHNLEGEVTPWAEALLARLDRIGEAYGAELDQRGWTTPGLDAQWLCQHSAEAAAALGGETVIFAGLHALSGAEEPLLRALWEGGAEFFWHSDPALAQEGDTAWPAREHKRWLRRWGAAAVLEQAPIPGEGQIRRFYEGYDLHSQLSVLERELAALPDTERTAVVLPDPGALVPVMHHLPPVETNISMGYPLERSALAQLVETILVLRENAMPGPDGALRYAWRDLIALVRHPLLRMLRVETDAGPQTPLKGAYVAWERHIRAGGPYQAPGQWLLAYDDQDCSAPESEIRALHAEVLAACFDNFLNLGTLRQAGLALDALCGLLRRRGGDTWRRNLIDAECLVRLWRSVVPELTGSILADEPYGQDIVLMMTRHLVKAERVSFEPEPLAGLQVLGMLETRLLGFNRLFILDATEDKLPGASAPDPRLPEPLRPAWVCPAGASGTNVAAHTFFRLLMGARRCRYSIRPGSTRSAGGQSERSRYVEQLLWELEQQRGEQVKPLPLAHDEAPLRSVCFPVRPIQSRSRDIPLTPALRARLAERLQHKGITPSGLELWLTCPKKAFLAQALGLRRMEEVADDGDRARFGELVHRVLKEFLAPHVGRPIDGTTVDAETLFKSFEQALSQEAFAQQMPFDVRTVLLAAGRERLRLFLDKLPKTTVLALEHPVLTPLSVPGIDGADGTMRLHGRIDRVDERDGRRLVLDYKTGGVKEGGAEGWLDQEAFTAMGDCLPGSPEAAALFLRLAQLGLDVQLPAYMHMLEADGAGPAANAAWVELKSDGSERLFFAKDVDETTRATVIQTRVPQLLRFVLGHVFTARVLPALRGRHCEYCDFKGPCGA